MGDTGARAMVQTGPRAMELWDLDRPPIGADEALIRVEACGICGSDIGMYRSDSAHFQQEFPVIRGHEPVGVVEEIGADLAARRGLRAGDRVAIDPFIRCGSCRFCLAGRGELCVGGGSAHNSYSTIPMSVEPGLWGGFATHLYANRNTILYPVPDGLAPLDAALFNVLGAGVKWGVDVAGTTLGSTVVVLGCGQRGLACALSALEAGASFVAVTGLATDDYKLELARELGVHLAINVDEEDVRDVVLGAVPMGVDVVIDTTPYATDALVDAVAVVRTGGKIVIGGMKGRLADGFPIDTVTGKEITIQGVLGTGSDHYERAIAMLARSDIPFHRLRTHVVPLPRADWGIQVLAGEITGERPLNIVIDTA